MKNKIQDLIQQHKLSKLEVNTLIEELNQVSDTKMSKDDYSDLTELKLRYIEEVGLRTVFISELESLL